MELDREEQLFKQQRGRGRTSGPPHEVGRRPRDNRQFEITHLWDKHHKMKRLALMGMSYKDIAVECGVARETVTQVMNSALMKRELEVLRTVLDSKAIDVGVKLREMNVQAVKLLADIMENEEAPIVLRAKIAMDNLSRTGFAPQVNIKGTFDHNHFTKEDLEQIKRDAASVRADALAMAISSGNCVDVEFESLPVEGSSVN